MNKKNFNEVAITDELIHNPYFSDASKDYVYKAKITLYSKTFGGIFIVKKIAEANHRIVFTTEMGSKLFDFSFKNDDFKVNYILENMNKKMLLNILEKDFRVLIREHLKPINNSIKGTSELIETELFSKKYYYAFDQGELRSISRVKSGKEKVQIIFSEINDATAKNIQILHYNIKLKIQLKFIN
jgi:hypothetical protein